MRLKPTDIETILHCGLRPKPRARLHIAWAVLVWLALCAAMGFLAGMAI